MALKNFNATSPGRRHLVLVNRAEVELPVQQGCLLCLRLTLAGSACCRKEETH